MNFFNIKRLAATTRLITSLTIIFYSYFAYSETSPATTGDHSTTPNAWIRPFYEGGKQNNWRDVLGNRYNTNGVALGFDTKVIDSLKLGLAVSYAATHTKSIDFYETYLNIDTRLAMLYGTYRFCNAVYFDWMLAGGLNYNNGQYIDSFGNLYQSNFDGLQYSIAGIVSKDYCYNKIIYSPQISINYVYLHQDSYQLVINESSASQISAFDANVLTLGVGIVGAKLYKYNYCIWKPAVQALLYYDVVSGEANSSSAFIIGGPALPTYAVPGRLTGQIGVSVAFDFYENMNLKIEYDLQAKVKYFNNIAYINFTYTF